MTVFFKASCITMFFSIVVLMKLFSCRFWPTNSYSAPSHDQLFRGYPYHAQPENDDTISVMEDSTQLNDLPINLPIKDTSPK